MHFTKRILFVISFICVATNVYSDNLSTAESFNNMKMNAADIGITYKLTENNLDITIDQKKLFPQIPSLVAEDIITKVNDNDLRNAPMSVTVYAVGITYTVNIMSGVYATNPQLNKLHVTTFVLPYNGNPVGECYSFDYTRDLYNTLNLNTTTSNDFVASAPKFKFTNWCKGALTFEKPDAELHKTSQ